ncbi:MAG: flavodoxin family protein [Planctomycetes bacterium]|nr:flavodoxin family protein [Planctomycetota bacterium]
MAKKILILCSSPNKNGKTNTVVNWCTEAATGAGAEVECVDVAHMKHKHNGCIACMGCQMSPEYGCVVDDEAGAVLKRVHEFDLVVFATPVYFFGPNAQLKLFLDRMFSLVKLNPETGDFTFQSPGHPMALIATAAGDMEDGLGRTNDLFEMSAQFQGGKYQSFLVPKSPHTAEELLADTALKEKAIAFGRELAVG